jgi:hypothetical protein
MISEAAIAAPRLHQVNPSVAASDTATSTPAITLAIRWTAERTVWYSVYCTTSSAVSGASSGLCCPGSSQATM